MADPVKRPLFGAGNVGSSPGIPGFESRPGKKPNTGELFELKAEGKLYAKDGRPLYPRTKEFMQQEAASWGAALNMAKVSPPAMFFSATHEASTGVADAYDRFVEFNFTPDALLAMGQANPMAGGSASPLPKKYRKSQPRLN